MARAGGQAAITGFAFELWFVALRFADVFFDDKLNVSPEVHTYADPTTGEIKIASIDDVYVFSDLKKEFYNIKYRAPNAEIWTFTALKQEKVLVQLKEQFTKTPDASLYFVSQSPCPIFAEILPRAANCSSREQLEIELKVNNYIDKWDRLKEELSFSDIDMLEFANQVKFKPVPDIEEIKILIEQKFHEHVTKSNFVPNCLFQLAIDAAEHSKTISKRDVIDHLDKNDIHIKSHLRVEELLDEIDLASAALASVPFTFTHNVHIEREEVTTLVNWIETPLKDRDSQIAVVTGKSGCGKTVILRDLLIRLQKEGIPVLAIKTDLLPCNSTDLLSNELSLPDGIIVTMATIVEKTRKGIVLFDQIDALSLSMSKDREPIKMYINLISQLSRIEGLRIILSCRDFDLLYDPVLESFENKKNVSVSELSDTEVAKVLSELGIQKRQISGKFLSLLKVPLHLETFGKIYDLRIDLNTLKTLQDLYDKLWDKKINAIASDDRQIDVLEVINIITDKMDESKTLSVPLALLDNHSKGRDYLLSESILYKQDRSVQFFHSSFFDYCYARRLVSEQNSLIGAILREHQGLFIRSQVKQVLAYLRDSDFPRYLTELEQFLTNPKVRFHIRLLVINQLGFLQNPKDEEWQIVKRLLDKDKNFAKHFISGVQSEKWLNYLISNGYIQTFLQSRDEEFINLIIWKLGNLINSCTETALAFLKGFPSIDKKGEKIANILYWLDRWDNEKAIQLFQEYLPTFKSFNHRYHNNFLEKIIDFNHEVVFKIFFDGLNEKVDAIKSSDDLHSKEFLDIGDIEIFEKLLNWNTNVVLPNALQVINNLIDKTKLESRTKFYIDMAFYSYEQFESDLYSHWQLLSFVLEKLEIIAANDKDTFIKLIEGFSESCSSTLLKIVLKGYNAKPELYVNEGYEMLMRDGLLENMSGDHQVRILLKNLYPHFLKEQKEKINELILSVSPDWEKKREKGQRSMIGITKYRLLNAIPDEGLSNYPDMKKEFLELKYKFGEFKEFSLLSGAARFVGAPLPKIAYEKMTLDQWISSFRKYDEGTSWGEVKGDSLKGGIEQHSHAFSEQVTKRPEDFYDFIFNLGKRNDISKTYFIAGLEGLIKAKYDVEKIKNLVKTYWKISDTELRKTIINAIKYINDQDNLDLNLVKILAEYALKDLDPEEERWEVDAGNGTLYYGGDAFTYGINTVRGWASAVLGIHGYKTHYPELLFKVFNKIAEDELIAVRSCLIHFLSGMIKWDEDKTYKLFIKLTSNMHPQIIGNGLKCIEYLMSEQNFKSFIPHLKKVMETPNLHNHQLNQYKGELLTLAYVRELPDSEQLLEEGLEINNSLKLGMISFSSRNLNNSDENIRRKSRDIYIRFINDDSDEVSQTYEWGFKNFELKDFREIYSLLVKYSKSQAIRKESHFFFEFLAKAVSSEPEKCIDLVENLKDFQVPKERYSGFPEQATQLLIEAYNRISQDSYKEKTVNIFDIMLQNEFYRGKALKVLSEQDRE